MTQALSWLRLAVFVGLPSLIFSVIILPQTTQAVLPEVKIKDETYAARFVSQLIADPITIEAGTSKTIVFKFKNTGSAIWNNAGSRYLSAYTMEPRDRTSAFRGSTWASAKQTGKIKAVIKPSEIGELAIDLKAPEKIGEYIEKFYLAVENHTWVKGGYFYIKIKVVENQIKAGTKIEKNTVDTQSVSFSAKRMVLNKKAIKAKGGEKIKIITAWQNVGTASWKSYALAAGEPTALAAVSSLSFADELWKNQSVVFEKQQEIAPGGIARETFYFRAPRIKGIYMATFRLQVESKALESGTVSIPVTVTEDAPEHYQEPEFREMSRPISETPRLSEEPRIRVGLWRFENNDKTTVKFVSDQDDYVVYKGQESVGTLKKNKTATLKYSNRMFSFKAGDLSFKTNDYIRLEPATNPHAVFTLSNWKRELSWKGQRNFNTYRGAMEYRLTQDANALYVINDVLFEDYIVGIGENADTSPLEYLKAQTVAQRTYAYYVKEYSAKHDIRNFDVVAHTGDQLYLGYESERIMPNFVQAAKITSGYMVTYNRDIVITPYFGNTDGRTRSWVEVWGGKEKPWLVSVPAIYDKRDKKKLYGHGVGMSQRDAAIRADEEKLDWITLIKYYYTGVEVERVY